MKRTFYYDIVLRLFYVGYFFPSVDFVIPFGPAPSFPAGCGAALVSPPGPMSALDAYRVLQESLSALLNLQ